MQQTTTACMQQTTTACMQQTTTACMQQTTTYAIQRPIGELTPGGTGRHVAVPIVPLSLAADGLLWVARPIARANWFAFPPFRLSPCNRQHTTSSRQRPTGATTNGRHAPIASPFRGLRFCAEPLLPDHTRCRPRPRRDPLHGTVQLPVPRRAHAVVWPATVLCTAAAICLHFEWRPGPSRNVLDSAATDNAATDYARQRACSDSIQSLDVAAQPSRDLRRARRVARALAQREYAAHDLLHVTFTIQHGPCN